MKLLKILIKTQLLFVVFLAVVLNFAKTSHADVEETYERQTISVNKKVSSDNVFTVRLSNVSFTGSNGKVLSSSYLYAPWIEVYHKGSYDVLNYIAMTPDINNPYGWVSSINLPLRGFGDYTFRIFAQGDINYGNNNNDPSYTPIIKTLLMGSLDVSYNALSAEQSADNPNIINIRASDQVDQEHFFGVWRTEDGINSAKWYGMTDYEQGYIGSIDISDFDYKTGEYQFNIFRENIDGTDTYLGNVKTTVNPAKINSKYVSSNKFNVSVSKYNPNMTSAFFAIEKKNDPSSVVWQGMDFDLATQEWRSEVNLNILYNKVDGPYEINMYGKVNGEDEYIGKLETNVGTVPVLMYHEYEPIKEEFKSEMKYLKDNGFTLIDFNDLENYKNIAKPVIVTFDDGYADNYEAYLFLKSIESSTFKPKMTIFMIANAINKTYGYEYLSALKIKEMSDSGMVSFQGHTSNHTDLRQLDDQDPYVLNGPETGEISYFEEFVTSKQLIEAAINTGTLNYSNNQDTTNWKKVTAIAYPQGAYNSEVVKAVKESGYTYGITTEPGKYTLIDGDQQFKIKRLTPNGDFDYFKSLFE